ncbi:MAG TPA: hypothetical protein VLW53_08815 [Candidatus Eisenbacteria bacterium]|nr:hypothetical protein [Candidatus Eisenbacteria bacterium]
MARKTKRRQPQRARRPAAPAGSASTTAAPRAGASRPAAEARAGGDSALVRSVEMSLSPGAPPRRGGRIVLDSADPAIPLDRVPYFVTDLIRLGITAGVMVVAMVVIAAVAIPRIL